MLSEIAYCQQASQCPTMPTKTVTRVAAVGIHPGLCNWPFFEGVPGTDRDLRQPDSFLRAEKGARMRRKVPEGPSAGRECCLPRLLGLGVVSSGLGHPRPLPPSPGPGREVWERKTIEKARDALVMGQGPEKSAFSMTQNQTQCSGLASTEPGDGSQINKK